VSPPSFSTRRRGNPIFFFQGALSAVPPPWLFGDSLRSLTSVTDAPLIIAPWLSGDSLRSLTGKDKISTLAPYVAMPRGDLRELTIRTTGKGVCVLEMKCAMTGGGVASSAKCVCEGRLRKRISGRSKYTSTSLRVWVASFWGMCQALAR